jgi:hypothetical protein
LVINLLRIRVGSSGIIVRKKDAYRKKLYYSIFFP